MQNFYQFSFTKVRFPPTFTKAFNGNHKQKLWMTIEGKLKEKESVLKIVEKRSWKQKLRVTDDERWSFTLSF